MPPFKFWLIVPPLGVNLLALGVGLRRRKSLDFPLKLLVGYLFLCALTTVGLEGLALIKGNNRILVHFFAPAQLLLFAWVYAAWTPLRVGRLFQAAAMAYCLACVVMLPLEDLARYDGYSFRIQNLLLMACSIALLCHLALRTERSLLDHPGFWIGSGVLCDMAITLVFYTSKDWLLINARPWAHWIILSRAQVVTISYLFFMRALTLGPVSSDK